jgi:hypothetical protein
VLEIPVRFLRFSSNLSNLNIMNARCAHINKRSILFTRRDSRKPASSFTGGTEVNPEIMLVYLKETYTKYNCRLQLAAERKAESQTKRLAKQTGTHVSRVVASTWFGHRQGQATVRVLSSLLPPPHSTCIDHVCIPSLNLTDILFPSLLLWA